MTTHFKCDPDADGFFGEFGGRFVPPRLEKILSDLSKTYYRLKHSKSFQDNLKRMYCQFAGRPSMLYFAENLTRKVGGAKIFFKREDLNHTGAHKINNCIGQALVAKHMARKKLIAETGAGQHGVATATVAAYYRMKCDIYMGSRDMEAQKPNVYRMKMLGANIIPVSHGQGTLKDAVDAAFYAYMMDPDNVHYLLGSSVGPHPYPVMVRDFQKIISHESRSQILKAEGKLPESVIACVGGGSNAIGAFYEFVPDKKVKLIAVEPAGKGADTKRHGLALAKGKTTVIHGYKTLVLQDDHGNIGKSYSVASGLDYPGVGPELSCLKESGRIICTSATDKQAVNAMILLSGTEGIIPALESAHAISYAVHRAKTLPREDSVIVNLSGRGDKDVEHIYESLVK